MLAALGLDAVGEAVYRAMLEHRGDTVRELAARLDLSEPAVRQALDQLSELALVRGSYQDPGQVYAVSPEVGLELLLARQQAELTAQQQRVDASRAAAAQLIAEHASTGLSAGPGVELLEGLDAIRDRLVRLTRDVREEVMTFAPDGEHTKESIDAARPLNEDLLSRGVRLRTVYLDSTRNSAQTLEYVGWLAERGVQVRTTAVLPVRMIIIDRSWAVIPADSDNTAAGALVLSGKGTLVALCALFERVWLDARPFGDAERYGANGLTGTEAAALKLLAEGYTDEAIAKRLGVSARTARRIATGLMQRLDARSRFEAGVRAVQRGWIG